MSRSKARKPKARIVVSVPLGTGITLSDGGFSTVARAVSKLDHRCEDGVYTLTLSLADRSKQWVVRLRSGKVWRFPDDLTLDTSTKKFPDHSLADPALLALAKAAMRNTAGPTSTQIMVIVHAPDFVSTADLFRNVQLYDNRRPSPSRSIKSGIIAAGGGFGALLADVEPGTNVVGFETFERKRVEQSLYALPGRRTIVVLFYGQASILEGQAGSAKIRKRRGVDPTRTLIVSAAPGTTPQQLADQFGMCEVLIHSLKTRLEPLDQKFADAVKNVGDPMLTLQAAIGVLALQGTALQRLEYSISADKPSQPIADPAEKLAARLLRRLSPYRDWPDRLCLGWRLRAVEGTARLTALPMLDISWRWASAHSVLVNDPAIIDPLVVANATATDPAAAPWLVRGSLGGTPSLDEASSAETLAPDLALVAESLAFAVEMEGTGFQRSPAGGAGTMLDCFNLSQPTERIVRAIANSGGGALWREGSSGFLPQLAASLGEPMPTLQTTIETAASEIRSLVEHEASANAELWTSDPNKGQFGSSPISQGAILSLDEFKQEGKIEFLALNLAVRPTSDGEPIVGKVTFYLHPTFSPSIQEVGASQGEARLTCYAWGAFTIGAELADGRRMELNLAEELRLPVFFRNR